VLNGLETDAVDTVRFNGKGLQTDIMERKLKNAEVVVSFRRKQIALKCKDKRFFHAVQHT
jgi:hypothetical protein